MSQIKNKQHYVFQAYLEHWKNSSGKVWCLDKTNSRVFPSGTDGILNKRQLYKIQELNDDELALFKVLMEVQHMPEKQQQEMLMHIKAYLLPYSNKKIVDGLKAINRIPQDNPLFSELQKDFDKLDDLVNVQIANNMEDFYSDYEGDGIKWINRLIVGDAEFYYSDGDEKREFNNFISIQYFRTVGMRNIIENGINQIRNHITDFKHKNGVDLGEKFDFNSENIDPMHIVPHMVWVIQAKCVTGLANANLQILRNNTSLPFITSDQPVINMKAPLNGDTPEEFVLFYPLSPKVAIVINGEKGVKTIEKRTEINDLNKILWDHSFQYVVSDSKEVLEGMIDFYN